jgi:DNA-binding protein YbaB
MSVVVIPEKEAIKRRNNRYFDSVTTGGEAYLEEIAIRVQEGSSAVTVSAAGECMSVQVSVAPASARKLAKMLIQAASVAEQNKAGEEMK